MSDEDERWRLPELGRLGTQFRELEAAERPLPSQHPRTPRWSRRRVVPMFAALALAGAALELVAPAGARSPVNDAPAAAVRSGSVAFHSSLVASIGQRSISRISEQGRLNLSSGDYSTSLAVLGGVVSVERRRVGDLLYLARRENVAPRAEGLAWLQFPAPKGTAAGEAVSLIDPQVIFRVLEDAPRRATVLGNPTIDGVLTTRYRLTTTLRAFLEAEGLRGSSVAPYMSVGGELDVWLDSHGRPLRVRSVFSGRAHFGPATMVTTIDFSRYGLPVDVRAPYRAAPAHASQRMSGFGDGASVIERLLFATP